MSRTLKEIVAELHKAGITQIVAEYDGSGDEGYITDIMLQPDTELADALWNDIADALDDHCPAGYENCDGGYGTFTIDVAAGRVDHEHNERYTEVDTTEETFVLED